jgi:hypothetical protein
MQFKFISNFIVKMILAYFIKVGHLHYKSNLFVKVNLYTKLDKKDDFFYFL